MLSPPVLREPFITRLSLLVSGVLIPLARSVENSILVSGVWSLVPELRMLRLERDRLFRLDVWGKGTLKFGGGEP